MDVLERVHGQRPVAQLLLGTLKLFAGFHCLALNRTTHALYRAPLATEQHKNQHESVRQLVDKRHTDAQEAGQGKPKRQRILDGFDAINDESRLLVRRLFPCTQLATEWPGRCGASCVSPLAMVPWLFGRLTPTPRSHTLHSRACGTCSPTPSATPTSLWKSYVAQPSAA